MGLLYSEKARHKEKKTKHLIAYRVTSERERQSGRQTDKHRGKSEAFTAAAVVPFTLPLVVMQ